MTDRRPHPRDWMRAGDRAMLEALREDGPERLPLFASARGLHLAYVEKRSRAFEDHGLIEAVGDGSVYRVAERGARYLDGELSGPEPDRPSFGTVEGD